MLSYTVYSEAGGVGKTSLTANLAVAHARAGLDVLTIPLDPQDGDLSRLLGVDDDRADSSADNLVRHMVNSPRGPFEDLICTADGVDVVPEHNMLSDLSDHLSREQDKAEDLGDAYNIYAQLQRVLRDAGVADKYDILICDPPATESDHLYNAIYATRNLVIPVEPSWKGQASVEGLAELASNFADQLNIDVGVLGAVPNGVKNTSDQREMLDDIEFATPETIGDRTSLMEGCWKQQCSAFRYVQEHRDRRRDYEVETLAQFDRLARFFEAEAGVDAPSPPEPGALEETA
ncbi:plasmid partitioning protein ParA (plasmid) [Haloarcula hispanica N601]|jgi:cellulose biosynthesis protein BcsQ|uniref:Chromosome partitioning ATPase n=4 Tax=Haloarcula TaxID=2237 RepID=M0JJ88_9EURY|nr:MULTISPECIES: ParA family protein [Haloarcula]AEM58905.1 ATPase involved in chromosome partitioning [Haloarcula hispanica ATCC 33960]AHB67896.1 plasmid partitioning protein ParA [Haloarcula hispanica N601]AUG49390.1 chromosome partitioning protein ParA [Haloarcula taiwanensis]EMA09202.1 chromosome partitioning ATPase [Haloarcula sinaiiensis ATCC 33800]QUJ74208.1 ParA family protein [Haloarcula sinaiiensis ATCC 33800]